MEPTRVGVLVDRTDPAALAAGLQVVLADEAGWRRVAEAGPAAVRDAFSVGRELRALYGEAVGTGL